MHKTSCRGRRGLMKSADLVEASLQSAPIRNGRAHGRDCGRARAVALSAAVGLTTLLAFASTAQADEVSPTGKGIVGGALLGGEIVTIGESLIGVRPGWAYAVGFGVGAAGGGIGGYFIEQSSSDGRVPTYLLAGGLALVIPAIVLTLNATRYRSSEDATEDNPPVGSPVANPGTPNGSVISPGTPTTPTQTMPPPASGGSGTPTPSSGTPTSRSTPVRANRVHAPVLAPVPMAPALSLLDINLSGAPDVNNGDARRHGLRLGVPVPEVRPMYSLREQKQYGLPQRTEVRMPVFAVTF